MRLLVTGQAGQVATALADHARTHCGCEVITLGRPDFDLADAAASLARLDLPTPDVVVNAAAYTAVDKAEQEAELAMAVNGVGAGAVASWAASRGVPIIQLSTDYVFDGSKAAPYFETDAPAPVGAYGRSKLAGERAVAAAAADHVILRTAWVHAAHGRNFVRTMLALAETRPELSVVADQLGSPSYAPDIAQAVVTVARNLVARPADGGLRGVFHLCGGGEASWADFAEAIFALSLERGGPSARVKRITTAEYPTPARRPANSRLDCSLLAERHGVVMPHWRDALGRCLDRLLVNLKVESA